ncbi:MAG: hypothetical protein Ct9H300mP32_2620 [Verrucomicrobiota bacterium]|nr:MAG: hypothetical protein Ct9H300mP32_2620 [Verrucomicrobiota bacterium]
MAGLIAILLCGFSRGFVIRRGRGVYLPEPVSQRFARRMSRFPGEIFSRPGILQVRRLGDDEQFLGQRSPFPGKSSRSMPSRKRESRFMVSLDEMLWELARMP